MKKPTNHSSIQRLPSRPHHPNAHTLPPP